MTEKEVEARQRAVARLRLSLVERRLERERFLRSLDDARSLGLTVAEISEIIGMSTRTVNRLLREYRLSTAQ